MTHLVENDPVRTLFGSEPLPARYDAILARILNDNFVLLRIEDAMRRYFGALAIAHASDGELWALKRRITLALTSNSTAAEKPGELNIEAAQDRVRLHNTGDHSQCTPQTCYQKAVLVATPAREAEVEAPAPVVIPRPAPAKPPVRWYVDLMSRCIVAEVPNDELMRFSGKAADAEKFAFRGEKCPAHVIAEYARLTAA